MQKIIYTIKNKWAEYLLEIIVIIIGILCAFMLNNWNEKRTNRNLAEQYLLSMVVDIEVESRNYENSILSRFDTKIEGLMLAKKYASGNYVISDTLDFMTKIGRGGVFSIGSNFENGTTYQELISTGNFKLIENNNIVKNIIFYYSMRNSISKYINNLRTDYARFLNSLRPFDRRNPNNISNADTNRVLKRIKSEEFIDLVNQELTYAYSFIDRVDGLNDRSLELKEEIEKELMHY